MTQVPVVVSILLLLQCSRPGPGDSQASDIKHEEQFHTKCIKITDSTLKASKGYWDKILS